MTKRQVNPTQQIQIQMHLNCFTYRAPPLTVQHLILWLCFCGSVNCYAALIKGTLFMLLRLIVGTNVEAVSYLITSTQLPLSYYVIYTQRITVPYSVQVKHARHSIFARSLCWTQKTVMHGHHIWCVFRHLPGLSPWAWGKPPATQWPPWRCLPVAAWLFGVSFAASHLGHHCWRWLIQTYRAGVSDKRNKKTWNEALVTNGPCYSSDVVHDWRNKTNSIVLKNA